MQQNPVFHVHIGSIGIRNPFSPNLRITRDVGLGEALATLATLAALLVVDKGAFERCFLGYILDVMVGFEFPVFLVATN